MVIALQEKSMLDGYWTDTGRMASFANTLLHGKYTSRFFCISIKLPGRLNHLLFIVYCLLSMVY
jgi:hypothetical protein